MTIACVLITHLRAKAELQRHAHLKDSQIVVVDRTYGKPLVVDSSAGASARAGMTLEQAMSCHNGLIILDADEPYYRRVFDEAVNALLQVSDRVESAELSTAYARLDGLELLHGGEANVAAALLNAVPAHLGARVGVGDAKFTSYIAARTAKSLGTAICPADTVGFLAPMSIELLPLSDDLKGSLHSFRRPLYGSGGFSFTRYTDRPLRTRRQSRVGTVQRHRPAPRSPHKADSINR